MPELNNPGVLRELQRTRHPSGESMFLAAIAKTSTGALAVAEAYNTIITNTGAAGAVVTTLPVAAPGMTFVCVRVANQTWDLNPTDGDRIESPFTDATSDAIRLGAVGSGVKLSCHIPNVWSVSNVVGTVTDVN